MLNRQPTTGSKPSRSGLGLGVGLSETSSALRGADLAVYSGGLDYLQGDDAGRFADRRLDMLASKKDILESLSARDKELAVQKVQLDAREAELCSLSSRLSERQRDLEAAKREYERRTVDAHAAIKNSAAALGKLRAEVYDKEARADKAALRHKKELAQRDSEVMVLRRELEVRDSSLEERDAQLRAAKHHETRLHEENWAYAKELAELRAHAKVADAQVAAAREQQEEGEAALERLRVERDRAEAAAAKYRMASEKAQAALERERLHLCALQDEWSKNLHDLQAQQRRQQQQLLQTAPQQQQQQQQQQQLESGVEPVAAQLQVIELQAKVQQMAQSVKGWQRRVEDLEESNRALKAAHAKELEAASAGACAGAVALAGGADSERRTAELLQGALDEQEDRLERAEWARVEADKAACAAREAAEAVAAELASERTRSAVLERRLRDVSAVQTEVESDNQKLLEQIAFMETEAERRLRDGTQVALPKFLGAVETFAGDVHQLAELAGSLLAGRETPMDLLLDSVPIGLAPTPRDALEHQRVLSDKVAKERERVAALRSSLSDFVATRAAQDCQVQ